MEFQILVGAGTTVLLLWGNDGTVCAGFVLGTFSKNSKVLWFFYVLSSVVGTWLALTRTSGAACFLEIVGTF